MIALVVIEAGSHLLILLSRPLLSEPIVSPRRLYDGQTDAIRRFLAGDRDFWAFDSVTGWRWPSNYRDELYVTNSRGQLSRTEYDSLPPAGRTRVAAFGNSFVVGADIPIDSSWLSQLGRQFPQLDVINYGVAAYGTDQSLLQYLAEGRGLRPSVVLIGLAADNLKRNVNVYRRFLAPRGPPLTKPRFLLQDDGALTLVPNPLRRVEDLQRFQDQPEAALELGRHDDWYQPALFEYPIANWSAAARLATGVWLRVKRRLDDDALYEGDVLNPSSSSLRLGVSLVAAFVDSVKSDGAVPLVVVLPSRASYERSLAGHTAELAPLVDSLRARRIDLVDVTDALLADPARGDVTRLFTPGLHYTPYASESIARWLGHQVLKRVPARP